jgi:hypothetical protein
MHHTGPSNRPVSSSRATVPTGRRPSQTICFIAAACTQQASGSPPASIRGFGIKESWIGPQPSTAPKQISDNIGALNWRGVKAMLIRGLAAIALLTATPAMAQPHQVIPPPEYDKPYTGKLTIERSEYQHVVRQNCPYSPFPILLGCAKTFPAENRCWIMMMDDEFMKKKRIDSAIVLRHETAHCNGWPSDHRGGKPAP